jgi:S-adenosylmethionine hydrolase
MTDINTNGMLVIQTDFGKIDGAVAAMYGIALGVNPDLKIYDLTHDIPPFNIFQASYRLFQSVKFWPSGTVFVSVVDPGVGSQRDSIIVQTETNHFLVTPDNGALTHLKESLGIKNIWKIDQEKYMRKDTGDSNTFHGRDLYAPVGALLASGKLDLDTFEIK